MPSPKAISATLAGSGAVVLMIPATPKRVTSPVASALPNVPEPYARDVLMPELSASKNVLTDGVEFENETSSNRFPAAGLYKNGLPENVKVEAAADAPGEMMTVAKSDSGDVLFSA